MNNTPPSAIGIGPGEPAGHASRIEPVRDAVFTPLTPHDPHSVSRYLLRARIGEGGMGAVYLSYTPGGRPIALKVARPELAADPDFRSRFAKEVAIARRVQGPYTVPVIDADPEALRPWIATAYVAAPSLAVAVVRQGALPSATVLMLIAGVAEALQSIHRSGVIHRDLKPGNVILADDGPRVIDFGVARAIETSTAAMTQTGVRIGTPAFMSPEQVRGKQIDAAGDVFALGSTAYYALTGRPPFGSDAAVFHRIEHQQPDWEHCPDNVREVLSRCLAKDPAERPTSTQVIELCRSAITDDLYLQTGGGWLPPTVAAEVTRYRISTVPSPSTTMLATPPSMFQSAPTGAPDAMDALGTPFPSEPSPTDLIAGPHPASAPAAPVPATARPHHSPRALGSAGAPRALNAAPVPRALCAPRVPRALEAASAPAALTAGSPAPPDVFSSRDPDSATSVAAATARVPAHLPGPAAAASTAAAFGAGAEAGAGAGPSGSAAPPPSAASTASARSVRPASSTGDSDSSGRSDRSDDGGSGSSGNSGGSGSSGGSGHVSSHGTGGSGGEAEAEADAGASRRLRRRRRRRLITFLMAVLVIVSAVFVWVLSKPMGGGEPVALVVTPSRENAAADGTRVSPASSAAARDAEEPSDPEGSSDPEETPDPRTSADAAAGAGPVRAVRTSPPAVQPLGCPAKPVTRVNSDGFGVLTKVGDLREGPAGSCDSLGTFVRGRKFWLWCNVVTKSNEVWWWARLDGTETSGWIRADTMKITYADDNDDAKVVVYSCDGKPTTR
ncbi:serine/threonine protein kinase [Frankia sp. CcI49]|uniref:serine/threonine-protein kinase n=1 Tax=unclassified Frankia TaxID=2632575 RepID=UPI0006CA33DC|nr:MULTISPECIES: serine/threonine-protein kinase [unclassified Frankia]KPM56620.1 serine/threonine protein kinase [Frankia sp. R43]ONH62552.1 serine/threonine protein kinase [Frankia sp. CcI49]